jgi:hypothetical protein
MRDSQATSGDGAMKSRTDGWNVEMPESPELRNARSADTRDDDERRAGQADSDAELRERANLAGAEAERDSAGAWRDIKSRFVDDPAAAIAAAEQLLREAVDDKIRALNHEAAAICARDRGEDTSSTEELRARLLRYQTYCEQLASPRDPALHGS